MIDFLIIVIFIFIGGVWGTSVYSWYREEEAKREKRRKELDRYNR